MTSHQKRIHDTNTTINIRSDIINTSSDTLSPYIASICKAANFHLFRLAQIRTCLTPQPLKMAVHSLVSSKMDYFHSLLTGLPKVQHIMNLAARLVSRAGKSEHITAVLMGLHWLPVEQHLIFKVLCLAYKAIHGLAPTYLCETVNPYKPTRSLLSTDQDLLCIPKMRLKRIVSRAFTSVPPPSLTA